MLFLTVLWYSAYSKKYKTLFLSLLFPISLFFLYLPIILDRYIYKIESILIHTNFLRYFFGLISADQITDCGKEFCEPFIQMMLFKSKPVLCIFYLFLITSIYFLYRRSKLKKSFLMIDTILCLGISILVATFIHPISIIPFAITFYIFGVFFIRSNKAYY